jgi:hypothetical protein
MRYVSAYRGLNAGSGSRILRKAQRTTSVQRIFSSNCPAVEASHLKNAATVSSARWISVESACVEVRWIVRFRPLSTIRPMDERAVVPLASLEVLHELELLLLQTSGNGRNDDAVLRRRRPLPPSSLRLDLLGLLLRRSADEKHAPASRPAVKPEGDFDRLPSKAAVAPPRTVRE